MVPFLYQTQHTADGGIIMMNDEEFGKFLKELRSAYGLPPLASNEDTVNYEDFITEDDQVSQSPSPVAQWRQEDEHP